MSCAAIDPSVALPARCLFAALDHADLIRHATMLALSLTASVTGDRAYIQSRPSWSNQPCSYRGPSSTTCGFDYILTSAVRHRTGRGCLTTSSHHARPQQCGFKCVVPAAVARPYVLYPIVAESSLDLDGVSISSSNKLFRFGLASRTITVLFLVVGLAGVIKAVGVSKRAEPSPPDQNHSAESCFKWVVSVERKASPALLDAGF